MHQTELLHSFSEHLPLIIDLIIDWWMNDRIWKESITETNVDMAAVYPKVEVTLAIASIANKGMLIGLPSWSLRLAGENT